MSFLKKLFGGGGADLTTRSAAAPVSYQGYEIIADPAAEGEQFRLSGRIIKEEGGALREHLLIRADLFPTREAAIEATIRKAKYVIDEQGEGIFN